MLSVRILGPMDADIDGAPVNLGSPRQRALLALLLTSRGSVVPVDRVMDQLWRGRPPEKATTSLHVYVSNLRRLLEPGRPPRARAGVLVSAAPGYAVQLPDEAVDAWRFEAAVRQARLAAPPTAHRLLEDALGWWRGPAYAEWADEAWAGAECARLGELCLTARELMIGVALRIGRVDEAVQGAETLIRRHPLREEGWRLLALALWASGRRADAQSALRRACAVIADELGLGPGSALAELEQAVRDGRTEVLRAAAPGCVPRAAGSSAPPAAAQTARAAVAAAEAEAESAADTEELFIGREDDLRGLDEAARAARQRGGVVLVTGEAGAGKSALLAQFGRRLRADGWTVVVGRCPEIDGAPPAWAWVEALGVLARRTPPDEPGALGALLREPQAQPSPQDDATVGRFRLHRTFGAWLRAASAEAPLAVVIDDLHRADGETLALLERVADLVGTPVLAVAAYRPTDTGEKLTKTLAELARRSPHRLALGGLPPHDVDTLVTAVCGAPVDTAMVTALAERTGGNPFYVWESARLLASEGALVATSEVPEGVRDVLRRRLRQLPPAALALLQLASVVGRETAVSVLIEAADADEHEVLDGLEAGIRAGLLTEPGLDRVRFAHELVRDTLYTDLAGVRRARMHARLAEVLRRRCPDDLPALAHHFARSGTVETAWLAVEYSLGAADLAERRYAHDTAVELLNQAIESFALIPSAATEHAGRLVALLGRLLRAQIRAGAIVSARRTRQLAIDAAEGVGHDELAAAALGAWSGAALSLSGPHGLVDPGAIDTFVDRLTTRADLSPVVLDGLRPSAADGPPRPAGTFGSADERAASRAAERQLAIARAVGDPLLLASALTTMAGLVPHELQADRRELLMAELRALGYAHDLPANQWVHGHIGGMVAGARNDAAEVRRHAQEGLELARRHRLVEAEAINLSTLAMLAHIEGRFDEAEAGYVEVRDRLRRQGSSHGDSVHALGVATIRLSQGRPDAIEPLLRKFYDMGAPGAGHVLGVVLAKQGRTEEARALHRPATPLPDHLYGIALSIRAELAHLLDDRAAALELVPLLHPVSDQLAGAASTSFASRPLAQALGELYRLLGDESRALRQFARAEAVARQWGSAHLAAAAARAAAAPAARA
ncbi:AAA family ATPase [Streptacidiphilus sp. PB12-B1b]|uniref:BTAD domain-containing putative transcriptional regulator n=1 Tax=Streptacidiphilus sp. PB12-B1b TaxID=2705012 RepID=UPI0015FAD3E1|nr:BTAD domain-containing putative transcriptional regulator [Streptacidiphilus sp. PB12-B1b]QMU77994.1 AAA family ATPase [Streptacidiphilus sp. PB12-B1b]